MKILYGAGDTLGSNIQLSRFISATTHEVRVAAHAKNHQYIKQIDWSLNAIFNEKPKSAELKNIDNLDDILTSYDALFWMVEDIERWDPDLVISDGEFLVTHIAKFLEKELWSVSPLHVVDGVLPWPKGFWSWATKQRNEVKKLFKSFAEPDKKYLLTPWDLENIEGFSTLRPYTKKAKRISGLDDKLEMQWFKKLINETDAYFNDGCNSYIADAHASRKNQIIVSQPLDLESAVCARVAEGIKEALVGGDFSDNELNYELYSSRLREFKFLDILEMGPRKLLHEEIERVC